MATYSILLSFFAVNAMAMESGTYTNGQGDALIVKSNKGQITLEETRQIGGPGGLSNEETVPYATVCQYIQEATVVSEEANSLSFKVIGVHLAKRLTVQKPSEQLANDVNCNTWVNIFDGKAKTEGVQFTIDKTGFKKQANK